MSYITPFQSISLFEQTFRHQINRESKRVEERKFVFTHRFDGDLKAEPDRYRLIWMPGCPHSNKAVLVLRLLGLDRVISIGEAGILRDPRGWVFSEDLGEVDPVLHVHYLDDLYLNADPDFTGRSTVPALVEISTGKVVNNEAWDLPTILTQAFRPYYRENAPELYPEALREEIDSLILDIKRVNAYGCGFARSQEIYDEEFRKYFAVLDEYEKRLTDKRFLFGDYITLADIHLYVALIRFHINYHLVFGVNLKRLQDYPALWGYTRDLYQTEGFREYTKLEPIKKHYQLSPHMRAKLGNVYGLTAVGPDASILETDPDRARLSSDPEHRFQRIAEDRQIFRHDSEENELRYLNDYLLEPIRKAGEARFQTDYERFSYEVKDTLTTLNEHLGSKDFLLGEEPGKADLLLYQTLLRFDHIYFYLNKLNFAKTTDFPALKSYEERLSSLETFRDSIDIVREREQAFRDLPEERNPYHLVFRGPEG